jgi:hypothetical protein
VSFFFFLLQNWRTGGQNRSWGGVDISGSEEEVGKCVGSGKVCRRVHMVQILYTHVCTHVCKWKNETC